MIQIPRNTKDHKAWLAYWSEQLVNGIKAAIAEPNPTTIEDFRLLYAIRCARIAHSRAMKAKPSLKEKK